MDFWSSLLKSADLFNRENIVKAFKRVFPFHASAWSAACEPVDAFLNEADLRLRDTLTRTWRDNMIWQLNIIIITSSVVSNLISAAFGWKYFEHDNDGNSWLQAMKAVWFCALLMSVSSIAAASQQLVALHRLSTYPNSLTLIRRLLMGSSDDSLVTAASSPASTNSGNEHSPGNTKKTKGRKRMKLKQAFLWQIPVNLLNGSLYLFIGGLTIIAYLDFSEATRDSSPSISLISIIIFTPFMLFSFLSYLTSSVGLYYWIREVRDTGEGPKPSTVGVDRQ